MGQCRDDLEACPSELAAGGATAIELAGALRCFQ